MLDWTDDYQPNQPSTTLPTRTRPLRGRAVSLKNLRRSSRVESSSSSNGRRTNSVADNTTKEAQMAQTRTKSSSKPTVKKTGSKTTTTRKPTARKSSKVTELVATFDLAKMPAGSGGIRYSENEEDGRDFLVFGQPYLGQDAFAALGLKEGDSIKVTVEKA